MPRVTFEDYNHGRSSFVVKRIFAVHAHEMQPYHSQKQSHYRDNLSNSSSTPETSSHAVQSPSNPNFFRLTFAPNQTGYQPTRQRISRSCRTDYLFRFDDGGCVMRKSQVFPTVLSSKGMYQCIR